MDKLVAKKLRGFFHANYQDALQDYAEAKIKRLHTELETSSELDRVKYIQGQIQELRELIRIQDTVQKVITQEG